MANSTLVIRVTHTGLHADGRQNLNPVLLQDLDVGYENQWRKVPVYVPRGGFIDIPASSRSMLSFERGYIKKAVQAGLVTATFTTSLQPAAYTNANRPAANTVPVGTMIWNTDDTAPNFSDGTNWRDAVGNLT